MPLLGGRHKSAGGGSPEAANRNKEEARKRSQEERQQVCESPSFGLRRQQALSKPGAEPHSVPHQISRQQVRYAFALLDTDADGHLSARDLGLALANLGLPIHHSILSHLMSRLSKRADQQISEDEFRAWCADLMQVHEGPAVARHHHQPARQPSSTSRHAAEPPATPSGAAPQLLAGPAASGPGAAETIRGGRRGSGSGLALMRALAKVSTSGGSPPSSPPSSAVGSSTKTAAAAADWQLAAVEAARSLAEAEARRDLRAAFQVFDLDGDGLITCDEVAAGLRFLGEQQLGPGEARQLLGPSPLSLDQFVRLLL